MREAQILHCDDNALLRHHLARALEAFSPHHRVVATAGSLATVLARLEEIHRGELDVNVLLLDDQFEGSDIPNHPGAIVQRVKELGLAVAIVGLGEYPMGKYGLVVGADIAVDLPKNRLIRPEQLVETLDGLPEQSKPAV